MLSVLQSLVFNLSLSILGKKHFFLNMALQLCVCVYICIYIAYIYASEEGILHVMGVTAHTRQAPHPLNAIRGPCPQAQEVDRKEMSPGNLRSDEAPDSNGRSQLPNSSLQSFLTHCFGCVSPI